MIELSTAVIIASIMFIAATVAGVAGFGFSLVATVTIAILRGPQEAVALTLPALAVVNISLASGLDREGLTSCVSRFYLFIGAVTVGGITGLVALDSLPDTIVIPLLIAVTVGTILSQQKLVGMPLASKTKDRCFIENKIAMIGVGGLSGLIFGATNVGILVVAYLKSCSLSQSVFAGVVGLSLIGTTVLRLAVGIGLGLYPSVFLLVLAVGLVPLAAIGTLLGRRLQRHIPTAWRRRAVLILLAVIGSRLFVTLL